MFAIAAIALLLAHVALSARALVDALPLPVAPTLLALLLYGLAIDIKLRKSELVASPLVGWALALAFWSAVRLALSPAATGSGVLEAALPLVLFAAISQGVQRFTGLRTIALTLLALAWLTALSRSVDPVARTATVAVAMPLAFAYFARNRSLAPFFGVLVTLALFVVCVILTRSRAPHFLSDLHNHWDWPTLVLGAALWFAALRTTGAIIRRFRDDADAAVAASWARALRLSLWLLAAAAFVAPSAAAPLFWIYTGLSGALWQSTRAHDSTFVAGAYNRAR